MGSSVATQEEKEELEALLASGFLARAPNLVLLLKYICERYFAGESDQIKEYNIAVEALGRPATFNQKQDSIVRVEASRLRRRLAQYYATIGAGRPLRIEMPYGQYAPCFLRPESGPAQPPPVSEPMPLDRQVLSIPAIPAVAKREPWNLLVWFGAALAICIVLFVVRSTGQSHKLVPAVAAAPSFRTVDSSEIRIIASPSLDRYVDRSGNYWTGDRFFQGGELVLKNKSHVNRTADQPIFSGIRYGDFTYQIPAKPGNYELHLHFVEAVYGEGNLGGGGEASRLFNVVVNGQALLTLFDVFCDGGGGNVADERVFRNIAPGSDGKVTLSFRSVKDVPMVSAIELLPMEGNRTRPVRIVTQAEALRQADGVVWGGDRYFGGGQNLLRHDIPTGVPDPEVYRGERFGRFSYEIPVAPGRYTVKLRFTEAWFGPGLPGGNAISSRLFNIFANGIALLRNLDVRREAGGSNRGLVKTFHALEPNAQGKLELNFVPVQNYAFVNAIEVTDEAN